MTVQPKAASTHRQAAGHTTAVAGLQLQHPRNSVRAYWIGRYMPATDYFPLPLTVDEVTAEWLTAALRQRAPG